MRMHAKPAHGGRQVASWRQFKLLERTSTHATADHNILEVLLCIPDNLLARGSNCFRHSCRRILHH
jgi:hypothetical protein